MVKDCFVKVRDVSLGKNSAKICVSITGEDIESCVSEARKIREAYADIAEWRVDCFKDHCNMEAVKEAGEKIRAELGNIPIIFTFRSKNEGGNAILSIKEYENLYNYVKMQEIVDIFDIEMWIAEAPESDLVEKIKEKAPVIISKHDFKKTPQKSEIVASLEKMQAAGASIAKIALMPNLVEDVEALMEASREVYGKALTPIISISMGELGRESRIRCDYTGSCLTFATVGKASAPGQVEINELRRLTLQQ